MGNGMIATTHDHESITMIPDVCVSFVYRFCVLLLATHAHTAQHGVVEGAAGTFMLVIFLGGVVELNQSSLLNENV